VRKWLSFLYGACAYLASQATLLYFIGFSGNLLVPRSVDVGATAPWAEAVLNDLLLVALFGLQHSVMARRSFKAWWAGVVPEVVERSTYVVATCAVLALLFLFWIPVPAPVVWNVEHRVGVALLWSLFWAGWLLAGVSTFLLDHFELFGLKQVLAPLVRHVAPEAVFRTPLLYRHVRHPLYAGFLLTFWAMPVMTAGRFLFALAFTAYIAVGIAFEERDLIRQFGERYLRYREQVGMLVPKAWARRADPGGTGPRSSRH
jgi:protein-S-isoprenylcysteine O-methyltransferase Ste14